MPKTDGRRALTFASLQQVMPEVDRLMGRGHTTVGKWTLGQTCYHLSRAVTSAVDDPGVKAPWLLRTLVAPVVLRSMLKSGAMPEGVKGPPPIMPPPSVDDRAEVEALRAAIRLFGMHTGPFAPHPFFGKLTREQTERFHCIHCAHHLGFLTPKND